MSAGPELEAFPGPKSWRFPRTTCPLHAGVARHCVQEPARHGFSGLIREVTLEGNAVRFESNMALVKLVRVADVPLGQTQFFPLTSGPILLANFEGCIDAVTGICPHQLNPLDGAVLRGPLIDCPWHHFQFDCRTGENHFPANVYPKDLQHLRKQVTSLKRSAVEVRDDDVWVNIE